MKGRYLRQVPVLIPTNYLPALATLERKRNDHPTINKDNNFVLASTKHLIGKTKKSSVPS